MKIYLDLLLLLNFSLEFSLLLTTSILLRRKKNINRILLASFLGGLSILLLFFKINSFLLFLFKILISIGMCLIAFGYQNIKYTSKNVLYLYITSILLGGFLYFLNNQFAYKKEGIVFYHHGLSINMIFLLFTSPVILYLYAKQAKELKNVYSKYHTITIFIKGKKYELTGFLDTGNTLKDPYTKKPVIIMNKKSMIYDINEFGMILVPYKTITEEGLLPCIKADKIKIEGYKEKRNILIGLMKKEIGINGVECILHPDLLEAIEC